MKKLVLCFWNADESIVRENYNQLVALCVLCFAWINQNQDIYNLLASMTTSIFYNFYYKGMEACLVL